MQCSNTRTDLIPCVVDVACRHIKSFLLQVYGGNDFHNLPWQHSPFAPVFTTHTHSHCMYKLCGGELATCMQPDR